MNEIAKKRLNGFKNLKQLKSDDRFLKYFEGNKEAIDRIHAALATIDPNDVVSVARLQGQLEICLVRQDEFDNCEKTVFKLENSMADVVKRKHQTGNVPPK